jgi:hypothetical protein
VQCNGAGVKCAQELFCSRLVQSKLEETMVSVADAPGSVRSTPLRPAASAATLPPALIDPDECDAVMVTFGRTAGDARSGVGSGAGTGTATIANRTASSSGSTNDYAFLTLPAFPCDGAGIRSAYLHEFTPPVRKVWCFRRRSSHSPRSLYRMRVPTGFTRVG